MALAVALPLLGAAPAAAQGTVVIGGDGSSGVEVNMDALGAPGYGRQPTGRLLAPVYGVGSPLARPLRIPGESPAVTSGPVQLRPPGGAAPSLAARPPAPPPARQQAPTVPQAQAQPPLPPLLPQRPLPEAAPPARATVAPAPAPPTPPPLPSAARPSPPAPPPAATPQPAPAPPSPPLQAARTPPPASPPPPARTDPTPVAPERPAPERAAPAAEPPRMALATPPAGFAGSLALGFHPGSASLTREAEQQLDRLVAELRDGDQRLQLKAFASADGDGTSRARRTSLSRALAVRSYLIEAGIRSTRIDVRALGTAHDGGAEDRVDVILLGQ